jgi:two-component system phosphate regulon sensor histidine kinase PhoR
MHIHHKIVAIFTITTAFILSGIYFSLNTNLREQAYRRISSTVAGEALAVKTLVEQYVGSEDDYDTLADSLGADLRLRVTIVDADGIVLGDSGLDGEALRVIEKHALRPEIVTAFTQGSGVSRRYSKTLDMDMFYHAVRFVRNGQTGVVRLAMPLSELAQIGRQLRRLLILPLLLAFFCVLALNSVTAAVVSRPLRAITGEARRIAAGDFSRNLPVRGSDEIGRLAEAFNYMIEHVRSRIEDVTTNKSRLEAVFLSMFDGVLVVDARGSIVLMNEALRELLNVRLDPVGKRPMEVIRNIGIQELTTETLTLKDGLIRREVSILMPEEHHLLVHATPIVRGKRAEGAVLVFHDISELRNLENIRKDFVANVSHELRTPIASILGYTETLLDGAISDPDNARDFLDIINTEAARLAALINDLLDLARIESGSLQMQFQPCSMHQIALRVIEGITPIADKKKIIVRHEIELNLPPVRADEPQLTQVMINLIDNAIKYTGEKGIITVSAVVAGNALRVRVSDTGIGIPEQDMPRIFERFYRVDKARSRAEGGTGLGLAIVKHIVQAHNGEIFVESVPGQGSTFTFTLPLAF